MATTARDAASALRPLWDAFHELEAAVFREVEQVRRRLDALEHRQRQDRDELRGRIEDVERGR